MPGVNSLVARSGLRGCEGELARCLSEHRRQQPGTDHGRGRRSRLVPPQLLFRRRDYSFRLEPELPLQFLEGR